MWTCAEDERNSVGPYTVDRLYSTFSAFTKQCTSAWKYIVWLRIVQQRYSILSSFVNIWPIVSVSFISSWVLSKKLCLNVHKSIAQKKNNVCVQHHHCVANGTPIREPRFQGSPVLIFFQNGLCVIWCFINLSTFADKLLKMNSLLGLFNKNRDSFLTRFTRFCA